MGSKFIAQMASNEKAAFNLIGKIFKHVPARCIFYSLFFLSARHSMDQKRTENNVSYSDIIL